MDHSSATPSTQELNRNQIAQKAYEIWLSEGCPGGRATIHWRLAEQQLRAKDLNQSEAVTTHVSGPGRDAERSKTAAAIKPAARSTSFTGPGAKNPTGQEARTAGQEPARW